jgi:hypothetical protein
MADLLGVVFFAERTQGTTMTSLFAEDLGHYPRAEIRLCAARAGTARATGMGNVAAAVAVGAVSRDLDPPAIRRGRSFFPLNIAPARAYSSTHPVRARS